jgi:uncharacterized membrane protein
MVETGQDASTASLRLILRPNSSLTPRQVAFLLAGIGTVMAMIGTGFAVMGLWPVLPFAGAEWLLLVYCFRLTFRACSVQEVITITEGLVLVEKGHRQPEQTYRFQRAWVMLDWSRPPLQGYPSRLLFRLHGTEVEVGRFLVESEREVLAHELQKILSVHR